MKTKTTQRLLAVLCTLVMVICLLPVTALAATGEVWVGGVQMQPDTYLASGDTTGTLLSEAPEGGYAYLDSYGTRLTLHDYSYSGDGNGKCGIDITEFYFVGIRLEGVNSLNMTSRAGINYGGGGFELYGDPTDGADELTIAAPDSSGIYHNTGSDPMKIDDCKLSVTSGFGTAIHSPRYITINNSEVYASATAPSHFTGMIYGLETEKVISVSNSIVYAEGRNRGISYNKSVSGARISIDHSIVTAMAKQGSLGALTAAPETVNCDTFIGASEATATKGSYSNQMWFRAQPYAVDLYIGGVQMIPGMYLETGDTPTKPVATEPTEGYAHLSLDKTKLTLHNYLTKAAYTDSENNTYSLFNRLAELSEVYISAGAGFAYADYGVFFSESNPQFIRTSEEATLEIISNKGAITAGGEEPAIGISEVEVYTMADEYAMNVSPTLEYGNGYEMFAGESPADYAEVESYNGEKTLIILSVKPAEFTEPESRKLSGSFTTDIDNGEPFIITVTSSDAEKPFVKTFVSYDKDGSYEIDKLPPDWYHALATKAGHTFTSASVDLRTKDKTFNYALYDPVIRDIDVTIAVPEAGKAPTDWTCTPPTIKPAESFFGGILPTQFSNWGWQDLQKQDWLRPDFYMDETLVNSGIAFEGGKTYELVIYLEARDGCTITEDATVTLNGGELPITAMTRKGNEQIVVYSEYTVPGGIRVSSTDHKTMYQKGEALDVSGMTIEYIESETQSYTMPVVAGMVSGFDPNTAGEQTLTIGFGSMTTTYTVVVFDGPVVPMSITKLPVDQTLYTDETIMENGTYPEITVTGGDGNYTYRWFYVANGIPVPIGTGESLFYAVTEPGVNEFFCEIKDGKGQTITSPIIRYTAISKLEVAVQPQNCSVDWGETAYSTITVKGGTAPYTYTLQGQLGGAWIDSELTDETDETTKTFELSAAPNVNMASKGRYKVTDSSGQTVTSSEFTLRSYRALCFAEQPETQNVGVNEPASFSAVAEGGTGPYTYKWYSVSTGTDGLPVYSKLSDMNELYRKIAGSDTDTLTVTQKTGDIVRKEYCCRVTDADGTSVMSASAFLEPPLVYYNINVSAANGTASASVTSAAAGETVTLTAVPAGGYKFTGWESEDVVITGNEFIMPDHEVTITAVFAPLSTEYKIKGLTKTASGVTVELESIGTAVLCVGSFDENGMLIASSTVAIVSTDTEKTLELKTTGASSIRAFIWDITSLKPMCSAEKISI